MLVVLVLGLLIFKCPKGSTNKMRPQGNFQQEPRTKSCRCRYLDLILLASLVIRFPVPVAAPWSSRLACLRFEDARERWPAHSDSFGRRRARWRIAGRTFMMVCRASSSILDVFDIDSFEPLIDEVMGEDWPGGDFLDLSLRFRSPLNVQCRLLKSAPQLK